MGDINDNNTLIPERPDGCEKVLDFILSQGGSRFIQHDHFGLETKRFGNFNDLHLPHAQAGHQHVRVNIYFHLLEQFFRHLIGLLPIDGVILFWQAA